MNVWLFCNTNENFIAGMLVSIRMAGFIIIRLINYVEGRQIGNRLRAGKKLTVNRVRESFWSMVIRANDTDITSPYTKTSFFSSIALCMQAV